MASIVLGAVGSYFGGPIGGYIGSAIGGIVDQKFFGPSGGGQDTEGPRLSSLKVQISTYGSALPIVYGQARLTGNVIWSSDLIEVATESESESGGGKGGSSGDSSTYTTYTYFANYAVALCEESAAILKDWRNNKLVYNNGAQANFRFYDGNEDQLPDSLMESYLGAGNVPAYRGVSYVVFERENVTDVAPSLPNHSFLVLAKAIELPPISSIDFDGYMVPSDYPFGQVYPAIKEEDGQAQIVNVNINTGEVSAPRLVSSFRDASTDYLVATYIETIYADYFGTKVPVNINKIFTAGYNEAVQQLGMYYLGYDSSYGYPIINNTSSEDPDFDDYEPDITFTIDDLTNEDLYVPKLPRLVTDIRALINDYGADIFVMQANPIVSPKLFRYNLQAALSIYGEVLYITCTLAEILDCVSGTADCGRFILYRNYIICYSGAGTTGNLGIKIFDKGTQPALFVDYFSALLYEKNDFTAFSTSSQSCFVDTKRNKVVLSRRATANEVYIDTIDLADFSYSTLTVDFGSELIPSFLATYNEASDKYIFMKTSLSMNEVYSFNPNTNELDLLSSDSVNFDDLSPFAPLYTPSPLDLNNGYLLARNYGEGAVSYKVPVSPTGGNSLAEIVTDLSIRVGLEQSQINVSELTDTVDGFIIPNVTTARENIEALMKVYYFDAVESGNVIKFIKRGKESISVIDSDDLAAVEYGQTSIPDVSYTQTQELDLPRDINVTYIDPELDYQQNTQSSKRMITESVNVLNIPVAAVISKVKAKEMADVLMYNAWAERNQFEIQVGAKYCWLEPTDVITIPYASFFQDARIIRKDESGIGIVKLKLAYEDISTYTQSGNGAGLGNFTPQTIETISQTLGLYLDINALRDEDNNAGFYWVTAPLLITNYSAALYVSYDNAATFGFVQIAEMSPPIGNANSELGNFTHGNVLDNTNYVDVFLRAGELSSINDIALFAGGNTALIGDEIIQFKFADLIATNTYRLSGLLRGRRGTEYAINSHNNGERFVLAQLSTWQSIPMDTSRIGLTNLYKTASSGLNVANVGASPFINAAKRLECYSPVHIGGGLLDGDILINWIERTRVGGAWRDLVDVTLSETVESYQIDIYDLNNNFKRTLNASTNSVTYIASDIATDFPLGEQSILVNIYQMSEIVGRGYVGQQVIRVEAFKDYLASNQWRLLITENNGSATVEICELEFFDTFSINDDIAINGTAIASAGTANNAFDGDLTTRWTKTFTDGDYLGYLFESDKKILAYSVTAPASNLTRAVKSWKLQRKSVGWQTIQTITNQTGWTSNEKRYFII